jgi:hypothetical protein
MGYREEGIEWRDYIRRYYKVGQPLREKDLTHIGVWDEKEELRKKLYKSSEREDHLLIQGGAFVYRGFAFMVLGVGAMDYLEPLSELQTIDGIVGTGNVLFMSRDFKRLYSALSEDETLKRYEIDETHHPFKWVEHAKVAPLVFLNRAFTDYSEFDAIKEKKKNKILYDLGHTFFIEPQKVNYRGREKLIKTLRVAHCIAHHTLNMKELIFDSLDDIGEAVKSYDGFIIKGYMKYSLELANSMTIKNNYKLGLKYNIYPIVAYVMFKLSQEFYDKNKKLFNKD